MLGHSYASRSGAGAYEQERFEAGRKAWRRRVLPPVRLLLLALAAPCIVYEFWAPSPAHFIAGFLLGACAAFYLWAREDIPAHVQNHGAGAEGERATAKVLRPLLDAGWHAVHNVDTGRGNRDHVVVGPGGVFLLDSKKLGGTVTVDGDTVRVERVDDPRDSYKLDKLAGALRGEAARLHEEILQSIGRWAWVTPVVVIWSRFDARMVQGNKIVFVQGDELVLWLSAQHVELEPRTVDCLNQHLCGSHSDGRRGVRGLLARRGRR